MPLVSDFPPPVPYLSLVTCHVKGKQRYFLSAPRFHSARSKFRRGADKENPVRVCPGRPLLDPPKPHSFLFHFLLHLYPARPYPPFYHHIYRPVPVSSPPSPSGFPAGGGAVYHDLGNVNLTFIETTPRLPEFVTYLQRTLDFLNSMGLMATGGERLGIYLNGLKISGSAQCLYKDRVLYHCTLLYDTDLTALHQALNPEPMVDDETLSSVYAVPSVRSEVTNIRRHLSAGTVTDFKEKAFQYFSKSQSVSAFTREEIEAVNQLREEKYIQKEWIYSR